MTELAVLNPEIEGLLREIAADPTSTLLRLPPSGLRRSRRLGELPDRAGTTGLNLAERELLRRWREEVAYLLLVACYRQFVESSRGTGRVSKIPVIDRSAAVKLRARSIAVEGEIRLQGDPQVDTGLSLIQACTGVQRGGRPSPQSLAVTSGRIVDSELATAYAALALLLSGSPAAAIRLMQSRIPGDSIVQEMFTLNSAHAHEQLGRHDLALATLENRDWPDRAMLACSISGCALSAQVGAEASLQRWSKQLAAAASSRSEEFESSVHEMAIRRSMGQWSPKQGARDRLRKAAPFGGHYVERVALVFN